MAIFYPRSTLFTTNQRRGEVTMGTPANPFEHLRGKHLRVLVQSCSHFDDDPSCLEHLRDFIEVVIERIYQEPIVRAFGKSRSDLAFRVFWMLAPQYELYGRRYCLPSKGDAVTDILGSLYDIQRLYALVNKKSS
ncbi:MAG: hypothetical protein NUV49_03675 [Patescibacteria group bacterium]|nr:hypothetical protein [Patescibacteria group bacterium]